MGTPDLSSGAGVQTAHFLSQEALSEDIVEYLEDHIQENLPVSWSHCLSTFLPSSPLSSSSFHWPLLSLVLARVHRAPWSGG